MIVIQNRAWEWSIFLYATCMKHLDSLAKCASLLAGLAIGAIIATFFAFIRAVGNVSDTPSAEKMKGIGGELPVFGVLCVVIAAFAVSPVYRSIRKGRDEKALRAYAIKLIVTSVLILVSLGFIASHIPVL